MKVPTKQQLYNQIAKLERFIAKEAEERDKAKIEEWNKKLPQAYEECRRQLSAIFPNIINLHFEHVDGGGFWFTFELTNDERKQTYAVRHHDLL